MACPELVHNKKLTASTDFARYRHLHSDGRDLICGWFARAWDKVGCEPRDSFEPFIFTWIAFNGWASCITELDKDRDWIDALTLSHRVCDDFDTLTAKTDSSVSVHAHEFYRLWPVFKAQEIRRRGASMWHANDRQEIIEHYLKANVQSFEPQCWTRHQSEGSTAPLDWPHTLAVLYRVRCNLFHGEKAAHSEMDRLIVSSAFRVLIYFLHEAGYIL